MDTNVIKRLKGHSGSVVELCQGKTGRYVKKTGNVDRNFERMRALKDIIPLPDLYYYDGKELHMDYIHGTDMKNYLINNTPEKLNKFLGVTLFRFSEFGDIKDYSVTYMEWLSKMPNWEFSFTQKELYERLPKLLPQTLYHGDMTLENIIHSNDRFYFIDPVTVPFDSYVFDIAKLRQDIDCKWFLRHDNVMLDAKLQNIREYISKFPHANDDYILILMLLRVYCHCEPGSVEYSFVMREVNRLWK